MKVWCTMDGDGLCKVFSAPPAYRRATREWRGRADEILARFYLAGAGDWLDIFPRNIKPGECKMIPLRRAGEK